MRRIGLKIVALLLALSLLPLVVACGSKNSGDERKIRVVCTLFPQYDWLREIVGESEGVELSLIIQNGSDLHSYEPTASDILELSEADMVVYIGDEYEKWVGKALEQSGNKDTVRIELSECEGIELHSISSESEGHSHGHEGHGHEGHDHAALDEHIWLSLDNALSACKTLASALAALDGERADSYEKNAERYAKELEALDAEFVDLLEKAPNEGRFLLFCDRFPFVYLLEDYGVEYAAAFEGCSTDVDADFATVLRLIKEADAHSLSCVAVTESSDGELARTVLSSSRRGKGDIIVFNSLQSVSRGQIADGLTYISAMRDNLNALARAFGIKE